MGTPTLNHLLAELDASPPSCPAHIPLTRLALSTYCPHETASPPICRFGGFNQFPVAHDDRLGDSFLALYPSIVAHYDPSRVRYTTCPKTPVHQSLWLSCSLPSIPEDGLPEVLHVILPVCSQRCLGLVLNILRLLLESLSRSQHDAS